MWHNYIIICHTYVCMYLCSVDLGWSFPSATRPCSTHRLHCNRVSKCPDGIPDDLFRLPQLQGTSKKACYDDVLNFIVLAPLRSYLWSADKHVFEAVTINYYTQKPLFYPEEFQEAANALFDGVLWFSARLHFCWKLWHCYWYPNPPHAFHIVWLPQQTEKC